MCSMDNEDYRAVHVQWERRRSGEARRKSHLRAFRTNTKDVALDEAPLHVY